MNRVIRCVWWSILTAKTRVSMRSWRLMRSDKLSSTESIRLITQCVILMSGLSRWPQLIVIRDRDLVGTSNLVPLLSTEIIQCYYYYFYSMAYQQYNINYYYFIISKKTTRFSILFVIILFTVVASWPTWPAWDVSGRLSRSWPSASRRWPRTALGPPASPCNDRKCRTPLSDGLGFPTASAIPTWLFPRPWSFPLYLRMDKCVTIT